MNSNLFSTDYFKRALRLQIKKNAPFMTAVQAMNSYYQTIVSAIIQDRINKNFELIRRIRNLDAAYRSIKEEIHSEEELSTQK